MDQLLDLARECIPYLHTQLSLIQSTSYRQEQDHLMDIENKNLNVTQTFEEEDSTTVDSHLRFFDLLSETFYNETLDMKIAAVKINNYSSKRKDAIFKRFKKEQEQRITQRRKQIEQKYPFNEDQMRFKGEFAINKYGKDQVFAFKCEDFEKLKPETDLNDTIIDNYLKLMQLLLLKQETAQKTHIFSTFFMGKLLGDLKQDACLMDRQNQNAAIQKVVEKVIETYPHMKRWTKKNDLFSKQYLVVPINAFKHWNCMIIVSPNSLITESGDCKIIYLDSMFEKRSIFPEAIKKFLELELSERKGKRISLENVPTYQLLMPRQTNTHDCGIYTLCYIQYLLKSPHLLKQNMEIIQNRYQLHIFPRSLIYAMRELLRGLFKDLITCSDQDKDVVILGFNYQRQQIEQNSNETDFDIIIEKYLRNYSRILYQPMEEKRVKQQEIDYQMRLKFYLDIDINYYEKDQIVKPLQ